MPTILDMIPAIAASSLTNPASLRVSTAVVRPGYTSGAKTNGELIDVLKSGSPGPSVLVLSAGTRKALVTNQETVKTQVAATMGADELLLSLSSLGNTTHEVTVTSGVLADVLGGGAAEFLAANITSRKPRLSLQSIIDNLAAAALAGGKEILAIVDRTAGTVRVLTDTAQNLATKYAAILASAGAEGVFVTVEGTEVPAQAGSVVYLN